MSARQPQSARLSAAPGTTPALCTALPLPVLQVPFEQVPDLVGARKVYLQAGYAYVSKDQMSSLVVQPFR